MDYSRSPEDNTSVMKMVDGFYRYLGQPATRDRSRSQISSQGFSFLSNDSSFNSNTTATSIQRKRSSDYSTLSRDEKADLIAATSKVARLENDLKSMSTEQKKKEIETEKEIRKHSMSFLKDQEECDSLRRKFRQVVDQKQTAEDELSELQIKYDELKTQSLEDARKWRLERIQLNSKIDEIAALSSKQLSELKEKCTRQDTELMIFKNKFDESDMQLNTYRSRQVETSELLKDYTELKCRCESAEHRVKELEDRASRVDEASTLMQRNQAELASFRELQRENKKIKEDNKLYRDSAENSLILKEKLNTQGAKLKRAEAMIERLSDLELENQTLKSKIQKWELPNILDGASRPRSPGELTRMIAELQKSQLNMVEKQKELEASFSIKDVTLTDRTLECSRLHEISMDLQSKNEQLEDKCQKLQRRFTLVASDRDGLRRVLSSYENDDGSPNKVRLQEAEALIQQYNKQFSELQNDLLIAKKDLTLQKVSYQQLQHEFDNMKNQSMNSTSNIKEKIQLQEKQKHHDELKEQYDKLKDEKEIMELRLERRELQGDYDPFKTKVLHLRCNPMEIARDKYLRDMENVRAENEKLRKKVMQLQQRQIDEDESMNVSRLIKSSKPMEEAMKQLEAEKLKAKRLEEQFARTAKDYRQAVYNLFGFSFKATKDDTYRVQSIYSPKVDDFFLFTCSKNKEGVTETGMIETTYAREWLDSIEDYLQKGNSIPAFLATVTLELFSRTTEIRDLTVAKKARQL